MRGLIPIVEACEAAVTSGRRGVLATVVRVAGSAYRRPGARMFLVEGGSPVGLVSGGCLEEDLAERAAGVLDTGQPRTVVYDMRSPDDIVWGLGLGCNGEVRVLLERIEPPELPAYLRLVRECERRRETAVVATVFERWGEVDLESGQRFLIAGEASAASSPPASEAGRRLMEDAVGVWTEGRTAVRRYDTDAGGAEVLLEYLAPTPRLLLFGAGDDARPVVRMARELGWRVSVCDHRPAYAAAERFPEADEVRPADLPVDRWTAVVVMTHHFLNDRAILPRLLSTAAPYIGLLGPKKRAENLLAGVADDTASADRVFGPVGLDIGSETPEEIALSLLAEIQAVFAGRSGGSLRARDRPLHDGGA
jgi:xanthine/CO dehydrogenase XdhC/CoxF family maturation factor